MLLLRASLHSTHPIQSKYYLQPKRKRRRIGNQIRTTKRLVEAPFCSNQSYCGNWLAHQDHRQASFSKGGRCGPIALDGLCGPSYSHQVCFREEAPYCSTQESHCGNLLAHQDDCQTSYSKNERCEQEPDPVVSYSASDYCTGTSGEVMAC
jgi:hypothetical protein